MTTGAKLASITLKKLMGFEDFGARMLDYLRGLNQEATKRTWPEGAFDALMGLSSPGNDQVRIDLNANSDGFISDGDGHLPDLKQITRIADFVNTTAVTFEVGAGYITTPRQIQINPRTGKPEFGHLEEQIGESTVPDVVTDNGGTITFDLNGLLGTDDQ